MKKHLNESVGDSLFINDFAFGKKFTVIKKDLHLDGYGGKGRVHPDLIPFPNRQDEILMVYTPENPYKYENMCLVHSLKTDLINWSDDLWDNPVIYRNKNISWKNKHLADFCLLYVPELNPKWWTWYQPSGSSSGCQIALGLSNNGIDWRDDIKGNPIMRSRDDGNKWEYDFLRAPSVLWNRHTRKFEMFYDNLKSDWSEPIRLCRAESSNGKKWAKRSIIYDPKDYGERQSAFHPIVRYFDGYYWCWFPRYNDGLWFMYSKTGLSEEWSLPHRVLDLGMVGAKKIYRAGALIDENYKLHMMISAIHDNGIFQIHYLASELSAEGANKLKAQNYTVNDYDFGGSVIGLQST
ncbi:MAG: hypothetical protein KAX49_01815 [Halanaerobiales bacterium]|nr:hypothetical protein [Halanaerobiales bacterium]